MINKEEILKSLDKVCFHDVPVEKISFKTDNSIEFIIDFSLYNEEIKDHDFWTIKFIDITHLKTSELMLNTESGLEITKFDYQWNNLFEADILFLLGFGQPSFKIELKCQKVELMNTIMENEKRF